MKIVCISWGIPLYSCTHVYISKDRVIYPSLWPLAKQTHWHSMCNELHTEKKCKTQPKFCQRGFGYLPRERALRTGTLAVGVRVYSRSALTLACLKVAKLINKTRRLTCQAGPWAGPCRALLGSPPRCAASA